MNFAGFWKRAAAYWIDVIPLTLLIFLLYYFILDFDKVLSTYFADPTNIDSRLTFLSMRNQIRDLTFIIWILYAAAAEGSALQGTFGKKILGIQVVDREGERIGFGRSILRNLAKILSMIPFGLGFLWAAFSKEKRGWHDYIARTYVVRGAVETEKQETDRIMDRAAGGSIGTDAS